jgi:crossover junction endodeoxyribonuclease RuvC
VTKQTTRILGIDPGSLITGFGVVAFTGSAVCHVASGCLRLGGGDFPTRLRLIFDGLGEIIDLHQPDEVAVEQVFMRRNADAALKLGQARGAAICAAVTRGLPVLEYSARQVKLAVVGGGGADKTQVQHMVRVLLSLEAIPQADAADALGVALCHGHVRAGAQRLGLDSVRRFGRWT